MARYRSTIAPMKQTQSKKKSHTSKAIKLKVLNQKVKRKDHQLQKLKSAQDVFTQAPQLDNVHLEMKNTKRKLRRLKEKFKSKGHSRSDLIINQVPTKNIPIVISKILVRQRKVFPTEALWK